MRKAIKYLVTLIYKPLLARYLSGTRIYRHKGIRLVIPPEVFHPGFFFSTKILLQYIDRFSMQQQSFLELGAGNGLIAMHAAKKGALAVATDINPIAIEYLHLNRSANKISLTIIHSDLFRNIPVRRFDWIAINPPYFKRAPRSDIDYAWYCGENGEYFDGLFSGLGDYTHADSRVLMILSDDCDQEMIGRYATKYGWVLKEVLMKKNWMERLFIYSIRPL